MATYRIEREGDILRGTFGERAQNDQLVKDATARLEDMYAKGDLDGGRIAQGERPRVIARGHGLGTQVGALIRCRRLLRPKGEQVRRRHQP